MIWKCCAPRPGAPARQLAPPFHCDFKYMVCENRREGKTRTRKIAAFGHEFIATVSGSSKIAPQGLHCGERGERRRLGAQHPRSHFHWRKPSALACPPLFLSQAALWARQQGN